MFAHFSLQVFSMLALSYILPSGTTSQLQIPCKFALVGKPMTILVISVSVLMTSVSVLVTSVSVLVT